MMEQVILELKEYNRYMKGMFSFVGFNTKWLEFHNVERPAGMHSFQQGKYDWRNFRNHPRKISSSP